MRPAITERSVASDGARHAAHLRPLNLERVLAVAIAHPRPFTRSELIEATGLSAPTIGSLVTRLIQTGLVTDLGTGPSRGGRRPAFMEFNARRAVVAGIHLGPVTTRLAVADLRGDVLAQRTIPTPLKPPPCEQLSVIASELVSLIADAGIPRDRLIVAAAGAPGAVDSESGTVVAVTPNLPGWSQVAMGDILRRLIGVPVFVENDVNLAVLGEHWRGAARGHDTCAFLTFGTGVGAGILVNGRLHRGHHYLAGEIALMCMGPEHIDGEFGTRGCLETLAGLNAVAAHWPHDDECGWIRRLFDAAEGGDCRAWKVVDEVVRYVGMAAANVSVVLDPSLIVLGGTLVLEGRSVVERVRDIVSRIVPMPSEVVVSQLGDEAPLQGALLVAANEAREQLRVQLRQTA